MQVLRYSQKNFRKKLAEELVSFSNEEHSQTVRKIIQGVSAEGDRGVLAYTEKFDLARLKPRQLRVSEEELAAAADKLSSVRGRAIREAIRGVKDFHEKTLPKDWRSKNPHGATVGENFYPLRRVGLYIPGGKVPLVSTVIMTAIPAKLAGVSEIAVATPPRADGSVDVNLLAALHLCGVREVYRMGGVQAIAALALGTETVVPVDKIAGPGNAYVIEAKRQLFGLVGIDLLPGPSEVMVAADASAKPDFIAAELLSQAEHGTGKERVFFATTEPDHIPAVKKELARQLIGLRHAHAITHVLQKRSTAIEVEDLDQLVEVTNIVAPEHLQLMVGASQQEKLAKRITTAGAILMGHETPTVIGDFVAGPSHTLPTGGTGRFASGLQVSDFMRRSSIVKYNAKALAAAAAAVEAFSEMEQLDAHGASLKRRL